MKTPQQIKEEITELKITLALVSQIETEGENIAPQVSKMAEFKSRGNARIKRIKLVSDFKKLAKPTKKIVARFAVCFLAVVVLSLAVILPNKTAMAAIGRILVQNYDSHSNVQVEGELGLDFMQKANDIVTYLPAGYQITSLNSNGKTTKFVAIKNIGEGFNILEITIAKGISFSMDTENATEITEGVHNQSQFFYRFEAELSEYLILSSDDFALGIYVKADEESVFEKLGSGELLKIYDGIKI